MNGEMPGTPSLPNGCDCGRYPWSLVRPLLAELMDSVLLEFEADGQVEVGAVAGLPTRVVIKAAAAPCVTAYAQSQAWHQQDSAEAAQAIAVRILVLQVGPPQAGTSPEAAKVMRAHLGRLLMGWDRGPPFTLQRFVELLLEPRKQYSRLDKLVSHTTDVCKPSRSDTVQNGGSWLTKCNHILCSAWRWRSCSWWCPRWHHRAICRLGHACQSCRL